MRTNIRGGKNTEHIRDQKTDLRNLWSLAAGKASGAMRRARRVDPVLAPFVVDTC